MPQPASGGKTFPLPVIFLGVAVTGAIAFGFYAFSFSKSVL